MASSHTEPLERARCALEGLSVGDAFGERFFRPDVRDGLRARAAPAPPWRYTDDTNMALSIFAILRRYGEIDQDALARSFATHYVITRGYGPAMHRLLTRIRDGEPWCEAAPSLFGGQGSFGNGSAMRVAPVGAYFADDLNAAVENARRSAEVTHAHPEAVAGAIAVAAATALAWQWRDFTLPTRADFIDRVLPFVPQSLVQMHLRRARDLPPETSVHQSAATLGSGGEVTCQDTVPFVLWCAGESLDNYEGALWLTANGFGDIDTTCAIVGGIVAMCTGIDGVPAEWIRRRESLPDWAFSD